MLQVSPQVSLLDRQRYMGMAKDHFLEWAWGAEYSDAFPVASVHELLICFGWRDG